MCHICAHISTAFSLTVFSSIIGLGALWTQCHYTVRWPGIDEEICNIEAYNDHAILIYYNGSPCRACIMLMEKPKTGLGSVWRRVKKLWTSHWTTNQIHHIIIKNHTSIKTFNLQFRILPSKWFMENSWKMECIQSEIVTV